MALPTTYIGPDEVAFLAESETITIIPRQKMDALDLLSGHIPAMRPPRRADVPLWLALLLKKQHRCNIVPPDWLNHENLERLLREEEGDPQRFCDLPFRWLETAELLLEACPDDLPMPPPTIVSAGLGDLRVLLRGLREIRQAKAREGLKSLSSESTYLQMNSLGLMEITELKPFALNVMDDIRRIGASREEMRRAPEEDEEMEDEDMDETFDTRIL